MMFGYLEHSSCLFPVAFLPWLLVWNLSQGQSQEIPRLKKANGFFPSSIIWNPKRTFWAIKVTWWRSGWRWEVVRLKVREMLCTSLWESVLQKNRAQIPGLIPTNQVKFRPGSSDEMTSFCMYEPNPSITQSISHTSFIPHGNSLKTAGHLQRLGTPIKQKHTDFISCLQTFCSSWFLYRFYTKLKSSDLRHKQRLYHACVNAGI